MHGATPRTTGPRVRGPARWRGRLVAVAFACAAVAGLGAAEPTDAAVAERGFLRADLDAWANQAIRLVSVNAGRAQADAEARLARALAENDREAEVCARVVLGAARRRLNDLPAARRETERALAQADELGLAGLQNFALNALGAVHYAAGHYVGALDLAQRAVLLAEKRGAERAVLSALNLLASCQRSLGDEERALETYRRALAMAEEQKETAMTHALLRGLASLVDNLGDRAEARRIYRRLVDLPPGTVGRLEMDGHRLALAKFDFEDGADPAPLLAVIDPILGRWRTLTGRHGLTRALCLRARVVSRLGRHDEALAHIEEATRYAEAIAARDLMVSVLEATATVQEARGDLAAALAAMRRILIEREAIAGAAARKRMADLRTGFDLEKKDRELARLGRENELRASQARADEARLAQGAAELRAKESELARSRAQRWALGGGALALATAAGAVILTLRARRRADRRALARTEAARIAAEEADALKVRLLGIASHDLKGPLRSMLRRLDRLESTAHDPAAVADGVHALRTEGTRLHALVRDLLDVSALAGGHLDLQRRPLDLAQLATEIVGRHERRAAEKCQALSFAPPAEPVPPVSADAARLAQVLDNLVDNAIKFTPPGGAIRLTLAASGAEVRLAVADNGPGLAAADMARMFQPFQTLSAVPSGGESSTGLGLHIAREIAALHGGRIEVDAAPGAGATFTMVLPATDPVAVPALS